MKLSLTDFHNLYFPMTSSNYSGFVLILFLLGFTGFSHAQSPHTQGQWSPKIEFDLVPVAVANLPDGRLVTWSSKYHDDFGGHDGYTFTQIFDPLGGPDGMGGILPRTVTDTNHDMFCPGINNLADGRILVTGGSSAEKSSIYDPKTQKWTSAADLNIPRGYQGAVTLADGSVFTIGGSWSGDATYGGRDAEIWTEATGWTRLTGLPGELLWNANDLLGELEGEYRLDNHAWLWAAPNGKIFHAGPGEEMHWIDVNGVGSYTPAGPNGKRLDDHESMNGNTAMFDIGKILKLGGSRSYSSDTPSNDKSYVIDINNGDVVTITPTANSMAHSRIYVTSVVLPNGEVLVLGGMDTSVVFSDTGAHLSAEMFNPDDNEFRTLASMIVPRTYHSTGILLNDGRVFMGGGGLCGTCGDVNHTDAEIYSPPYLFDANGDLAVRPILNAPDKAFYARQLTVNATPGIQEFSFMRMSSATHSVNNEQRRVPVDFTSNTGTYVLDMPNANLMPPGYYMLFALNADGVPSIAEAVMVGPPDSIINGNNLLVEFDFFEGSGALVMDTSRNENHGTMKERDDDGAPTGLSREYWSTDGLSGNALEMDGIEHQSNTILEIPYTSTLPANLTDQITVMAWVNRNSGSVVLGTNKVPNVSIFSHDYPRSFFMGYHDSQFKTEFRTSTGGHFNGYTEVLYKPGEWQHFVSTYDGNLGRVYVDGVQIFQQEVSGNLIITNENNPFSTFTLSGFYDRRTEGIGTTETLPVNANLSGITDELDGRMDKFKLYNIALTPEDIQRIYNEERKVVVNEDPCDDVSLVYDINGKKDHGLKEIVVREGDNIELSLELEDADYAITSVTYGENNIPSSSIITSITSAQTGTYKVNYALKKISMAPILVVRAVDSEMGEPNSRPGTDAADRDHDSTWHTAWSLDGDYNKADQLPHWIDLDLGEEFNVSGLEYLPRQDEDSHGTIADYEIYVSNSFAQGEWGAPVAVGTWIWNDRNAKMVNSTNFTEKSGRYVRLISTREVDGRPFTSAAEIRVELTENTICEKEIQINVHTPITYTYDNDAWSSAGDPSGESTKFDDIIINEGQGAVISKNTLVNNLTINAGAALTVGTNVILTFNEITLNSTSTSYASLIDNGWIAATVSYNRHVNIMGTEAGGGNDLISSPVTGVIFDSDFVAANLNLAEHPDKNGIFAFAPFVVANNKYENFNIGLDKLERIPIVPGSGYRVATANDSTLIFKGNITRNSVNVAISDAVAGRAWNLIGNPYPSYIDVEEFFAHNASKLQEEYVAIYGYTGVKDSWEIYNEATSGELIAPGQGFFVKAKSGGGTIRFTPSMRRIGSSDDFIEGRPTNANKALSKLKLSSATNSGITSIYFIDGTTRGLDHGYDAAAYSATAVDFSIFTNLLEDHKGLDIAIQSLPYEDFNDVVVPLGIKAKAGAELSISIDGLSTIPSNINVYLEDTQNNTLTLLNKTAYKFKSDIDMNDADRFNVHYSSRTLSIADMQSNDLRIYTTVVPKALVITGQLTSATTANLYDIQGRLVLSKVMNPNSTENTMDISTLGTGVYVVKVNNDNQLKTQKVIIK
ncbi:MAG: galactose oxidase-like domain-containing protein [Gelidibacter sp.]